MKRNNLLKASAIAIPLMGVPAAASAECPPATQETAGIEIVIQFGVEGNGVPAWGEGDKSEVPGSNPVRLLTAMRDPANSMIDNVGRTWEEPKSPIEILAGNNKDQFNAYIGDRAVGLRKPLAE